MPTKRGEGGRRLKKAPRLEKCDGYSQIENARSLAKKKSTRPKALKEYIAGLKLLEAILKKIDDSSEKKKFEAVLKPIRAEKNKLEEKLNSRSKTPKKGGSATSAGATSPMSSGVLSDSSAPTSPISPASPSTPGSPSVSSAAKLEGVPGYEMIERAKKYEKDGQIPDAVESFRVGVELLMKSLDGIVDSDARQQRRNRIDSIEHHRHMIARNYAQKCRDDPTLPPIKRRSVLENKTLVAALAVPFEEVTGYQDCVKADKFYQDGKFDEAEKYYLRALPRLEDHLNLLPDGDEKSNRQARVDGWGASLKEIQNLKESIEESPSPSVGSPLPDLGDDRGSTTIMDALIAEPTKKKSGSRRTSLTLALKSTSLAGYSRPDSGGLAPSAEQDDEEEDPDELDSSYLDSTLRVPMAVGSRRGSGGSSGTSSVQMMRRTSGGDGPVEKHFQADLADKFTIKMLKQQGSKGRLLMLSETMSNSAGTGSLSVVDISPAMFTSTISGGSELFSQMRHGYLNTLTIQEAALEDFFTLLHSIVFAIFKVPLPFLVSVREPLYQSLLQKVETHPALEQRLLAFLYSYREVPVINAVFKDHHCYPQFVPRSALTKENLGGGDGPTGAKMSPVSEVSDVSDFKFEATEDETSEFPGVTEFEAHYKERDLIWFFRTLWERQPEVGFVRDVDTDLVIYDPMGSLSQVHKVEVVRRFDEISAKPILVNLFTRQKLTSESLKDPTKIDIDEMTRKRSQSAAIGSTSRTRGSKAPKKRTSKADDALDSVGKDKKPSLLEDDPTLRVLCQVFLKCGDDLRTDRGALDMLRFMNSIWHDCNLYYHGYPIQARIYKVLPMGDDFGAIEFIKDCHALNDLEVYKGLFTDEHLRNLVASAAASFVAAYVVGVRERNWNNVLVRNDGTLFHIDFGSIMGGGLLSSAAESSGAIAISKDLWTLLGGDKSTRVSVYEDVDGKEEVVGPVPSGDTNDDDEDDSSSEEIISDDDEEAQAAAAPKPSKHVSQSSGTHHARRRGSVSVEEDALDGRRAGSTFWDDFVDLAVEAYMALRGSFPELAEYAQITFACTELKEEPEAFLLRRLMADPSQSEEFVKEKIKKKFQDAPQFASV